MTNRNYVFGHQGCCGMYHVVGIDNLTGETEDYIKNCFTSRGLTCEVTLIDSQLSKEVISMLKEYDFELVNRFQNPNTGNMVNVFHRSPTKMNLNDSPFLKEK